MKKLIFVLLFLLTLSSLIFTSGNHINCAFANEIETIEDDCNDKTLMMNDSTAYVTSGDQGFGNDYWWRNRNVNPTQAPTLETWNDGTHLFAKYQVSGQNTMTVVQYENNNVKGIAPFVFATTGGGNVALEATLVSTETSSKYNRSTYTFAIPEDATYVVVVPSAFGSDALEERITRTVIEYVEEPAAPVIEDIYDDLEKKPGDEGAVSTEWYKITRDGTDHSYSSGKRGYSQLALTEAPTSSTFTSYPYMNYVLSGQNLVTIVVEVPTTVIEYMPHIVFAYRTNAGSKQQMAELNNYSVNTIENNAWSQITYKFVLSDDVISDLRFVRVYTSAYNSYNGVLNVNMQQIVSVKFEYTDTLPTKDDSIPVIKTINKETDILALKAEKKGQLDALVGTLTETDYDASDWATLTGYVTTFENTTFTELENVTTAYNEAVTNINAVKTILEKMNDELADKSSKIDALVTTLNEEDYSETNWATLTGYVTTFKNGSYATAQEVTDAYNAARTSILAVKSLDTEAEELRQAIQEEVNTKKALLLALKNEEDYSETNWNIIIGYITQFEEDNYATIEAVTTAYNATVENIYAVKTVTQEAQELKDAIDALVLEKAALLNASIIIEDYKPNNWTIITGYISAFSGGTYATLDEVAEAYNTAVSNIGAVQTTITQEYNTFDPKPYTNQYSTTRVNDVRATVQKHFVTTTKSPTIPGDSTNWSTENYAYIEMSVSGHNYITLRVEALNSEVNYLPHLGLVEKVNTSWGWVELNNYTKTTSQGNYAIVEYGFVISEDASLIRVIFTSYNAYDSSLLANNQYLSYFKMEYKADLPTKDDNIPVIPLIEKEVIEPIVDNFESLEKDQNNVQDYWKVRTDENTLISTSSANYPIENAMSNQDFSYIQYGVAGHNVLTIEALVKTSMIKYIDSFEVYAKNGDARFNIVELNNVFVLETQGDYTLYKFVYVFTGQKVRIFFTTFNSIDSTLSVTDLKIKQVMFEALDETPEKDNFSTEFATQIAELDSYLSALDLTLYKDSNVLIIKSLIYKAKHDLTADNKDTLVNETKTVIEAIKTIEQEFNEQKNALLVEFAEYYNAYKSTDYSTENYTEITRLYNEALADIENITNLTAIEEIISDTKNDMDLVETLREEEEHNPTTTTARPTTRPSQSGTTTRPTQGSNSTTAKPSTASNPTSSTKTGEVIKKGCKSVSSLFALTLGISLVSIVLIKKKRREE